MKILINTSNLKKGGALQVAHSFLYEIKNNPKHEFHIVLTPTLKNQIIIEDFPSNFSFHIYDIKPSLIKTLTSKNKFLNSLEKNLKPNCVFSIFGPSNWRPKSPHLLGIANGWWYYPDSPVWNKIKMKERFLKKSIHWVQKRQIKREGDFFVVETEDAKKRITKYLRIKSEKIFVVSNTSNQVFNTIPFSKEKKQNKTIFNFITVSAFYKHKNLEIIKLVIEELNKKNIKNVIFHVTLPESDFKNTFLGIPSIKNLGPINIEDLPSVYSKMDAVFLPTLMETFSASYPEAMKMGLPILTSDLSFAHDICEDAALYFNPLNPDDIVSKIEQLLTNQGIMRELTEKGTKRLTSFETPNSRANKYLALCKLIVKI